MLVDAPFADILREWQWSKPSGTTALFWAARGRGRRSRRGRTLPPAADGVRVARARRDVRRGRAGGTRRDLVRDRVRCDPAASRSTASSRAPTRPRGGSTSRSRSRASPVSPSRSSSRSPARRAGSSRSGPRSRSRPSVRRRATRASTCSRPTARPTGCCWRIPELRGRIAYDVRFELYDPETIERISALREPGGRGVEVARRRLPRRDRRRARPPPRVPRGARRAAGLPRRRDRGRRAAVGRLRGAALRRLAPIALFVALPIAVVTTMFVVGLVTGPLAHDFKNGFIRRRMTSSRVGTPGPRRSGRRWPRSPPCRSRSCRRPPPTSRSGSSGSPAWRRRSGSSASATGASTAWSASGRRCSATSALRT